MIDEANVEKRKRPRGPQWQAGNGWKLTGLGKFPFVRKRKQGVVYEEESDIKKTPDGMRKERGETEEASPTLKRVLLRKSLVIGKKEGKRENASRESFSNIVLSIKSRAQEGESSAY